MPHKQKIQPDPISKIANDGAADTTENSKADNNHKDSKKKQENQMQESQSDGSIIKNHKRSKFTQKIVSKVKSWNSKDGKGLQEHKKGVSENTKRETLQNVIDNELAHELEGVTLQSSESDEGVPQPEHLKARDSLENILSPKKEEVTGEVANSKSSPSTSQEKSVTTTLSHTDSHMANIKASSTDAIAKVLAWDPWDKLNRKNKREYKRRKAEKVKTAPMENTNGTNNRIRSPTIKTKNRVKGYEEPANNDDATDDMDETYEYKPYKTKKKKSVEFINQVLVVYYANDEILAETTEPLKKETEQQIRNKEMRKGHIPATIMDRRRCNENFMSWF
ncbi:uncharacterized protein LOC108733587 [Agrilus planipennis]|uniref:Uncharacterized protein LOC108733587 n=1 Tax=Agrilus planipennis TaxID=224129 RepID=A0A1W4WIL8_AGRPL|nr:uncharacterized protein LOC108733587 [Agrilus planipennis]